jgi:hypothetical protein
MSERKYKIEIEPLSSDGYYVNVFLVGYGGGWEKSHKLSDLCLTYWGARYKAWWVKTKIENNWIKTKREKETVYGG